MAGPELDSEKARKFALLLRRTRRNIGLGAAGRNAMAFRRLNQPVRGPRPPTWQEYRIGQSRDANKPTYPLFRPGVRLDPSQVRVVRDQSLLERGAILLSSGVKNYIRGVGAHYGGRDRLREGLQRLESFAPPPKRMMPPTAKSKGTASVRTRSRNIQAMAVPRGSDVARAAGSLVRGRLPNGSLLSTLVRSFGASAGRSQAGNGWGSAMRDVITQTAPSLSQSGGGELLMTAKRAMNVYNRDRQLAGLRPVDFPGRRSNPGNLPSSIKRIGGLAGNKGPFVRTVRLNPSMVTDRRGNTPVETRAGWNGQRRVGQMFPNLIPVSPLQRVNPTSVPRVTMSSSARMASKALTVTPTVARRTTASRTRLTLR